MNMKRLILFFFISLGTAQAQLRLPALFVDHMVLQQQTDVPVWGWAHPGQIITLKGSWNNEEVRTTCLSDGSWKAKIKTASAGGPYTLSIKSDFEIVLNDVMLGEVWLVSGQSNMEWSVYNGAADAIEDMPNANIPGIRLFLVKRLAADHPQIRGEGQWALCSPESMKPFSAVGYFFGKKLHKELNVPVGIICSAWGGTPAETWTPDSLIWANPDLAASARKLTPQPWGPQQPGKLFNGMINPLAPYALAGILWYQGEANTGAAATYKSLMETLITSWRKSFQRNLPFYYVQIAPFRGYGEVEYGTLIREQQSFMQSIPGTGMVVVSDLVDNVDDIHPKYKRPVAERLANYALADTYHRAVAGYRSPIYKNFTVVKDKAIVSFDYCPNGLTSNGGAPTEFLIAGEDRKFVPAQAKIKGNTVEVWAKGVKHPVAVRFGWPNGSIPNLFSAEGLPVSCFRTDQWPIGQ